MAKIPRHELSKGRLSTPSMFQISCSSIALAVYVIALAFGSIVYCKVLFGTSAGKIELDGNTTAMPAAAIQQKTPRRRPVPNMVIAQTPAPAQLFDVGGYVVDQAGNPVEGVDVFIHPGILEELRGNHKGVIGRDITNQGGVFKFVLPRGEYQISFRLGDKEFPSKDFFVSSRFQKIRQEYKLQIDRPTPQTNSNESSNGNTLGNNDNERVNNANKAGNGNKSENKNAGTKTNGPHDNRPGSDQNSPQNNGNIPGPEPDFGGKIATAVVVALIVLGLAGALVLAGLKLSGGFLSGGITGPSGGELPPDKASNDIPIVGGVLAQDQVHCTLYAPSEVSAGSDCLIQVFAHLLDQAAKLDGLAKELDPEARKQLSEVLRRKITRGSDLTFRIQVPGIELDEDEQVLKWLGQPDSVEFIIPIPETHGAGRRFGRVLVYENNEEIGKIAFRINIAAREQQIAPQKGEPVVRGTMTQDDFAFVSYASKDKQAVYSFVQLMEVLKYKFYIDIIDIDAGERWEKKLYEFIDTSEVFLLFWSRAASESEWVIREAKRAEERTGKERRNPPKIIIYHLDRPPIAVPDWLKDIQYDRKWAEIIGNIERIDKTTAN